MNLPPIQPNVEVGVLLPTNSGITIERKYLYAKIYDCIIHHCFVLPSFLFPIQANAHTNKVAIVIDDFGNNMKGTNQMLSLPIPLTVAVMPFLPSTKEDAIVAHKKGHEVIIHMPMEPIKGKKNGLGRKQLQLI